MQFHQTILSGARNPSLARTLEESQTLLRIFIITCNGNDPLRLSLACEDHQQIIDALAAGDADGAHAAMSRHIRQSLQLTLDHLDTPQANEPSPHHADGD